MVLRVRGATSDGARRRSKKEEGGGGRREEEARTSSGVEIIEKMNTKKNFLSFFLCTQNKNPFERPSAPVADEKPNS